MPNNSFRVAKKMNSHSYRVFPHSAAPFLAFSCPSFKPLLSTNRPLCQTGRHDFSLSVTSFKLCHHKAILFTLIFHETVPEVIILAVATPPLILLAPVVFNLLICNYNKPVHEKKADTKIVFYTMCMCVRICCVAHILSAV